MADQYAGPFTTSFAAVTAAGTINAALKTQLAATILEMQQLFNGTIKPSAHPDFNKIPYESAVKINAELAGLAAAIAAHA